MNFKLIKLLVFGFGLIFFCSCKKDSPQTTVEGIVMNKITGEFISNVPIEIIYCDFGSQKCLTTINTVYTDSNGHYSASFFWGKGTYKIAVGVNSKVSNTQYPYYISIPKRNGNNIIDFFQFPLKTLKIHYKIQRHDKNWLRVGLYETDQEGDFSADFYTGPNPINDFDSTYQISIQAGRTYRAHVSLSNKMADNTYEDSEFIFKPFEVENIDTTRVEFIVP